MQAPWTDRARTTLLASGWPGIEQLLGQDAKSRSGSRQTAVEDLRNDLANHHQHLHDAQRLARGQSIGSGQVEGGCKNLIGRRLKQTGARWRVRRVNRLAGLCSPMDSHPWKTYRQTARKTKPSKSTRAPMNLGCSKFLLQGCVSGEVGVRHQFAAPRT